MKDFLLDALDPGVMLISGRRCSFIVTCTIQNLTRKASWIMNIIYIYTRNAQMFHLQTFDLSCIHAQHRPKVASLPPGQRTTAKAQTMPSSMYEDVLKADGPGWQAEYDQLHMHEPASCPSVHPEALVDELSPQARLKGLRFDELLGTHHQQKRIQSNHVVTMLAKI